MTLASSFAGYNSISRRELFCWLSGSLILANMLRFFEEMQKGNPDALNLGLPGFTAFHILAWYAVIRLLSADRSDDKVTGLDEFAAIIIGLFNFMPSSVRFIGLAAGILAAFIYARSYRGAKRRSAATVLAAISANMVIGPLFFSYFAFDILRADAALVGSVLDKAQSGFIWHDNVIETTGHSIEIFTGCSSFHNVSLAALCWVTMVMLNRGRWLWKDLLFGLASCLSMIILNATRLYLMAQSVDYYYFWHDGSGAQIFVVVSTAGILLISLWGASMRKKNE